MNRPMRYLNICRDWIKRAAIWLFKFIIGESLKVGLVRLAAVLALGGGVWIDQQDTIEQTKAELYERVTILEHELAWQSIRARELQRQLDVCQWGEK